MTVSEEFNARIRADREVMRAEEAIRLLVLASPDPAEFIFSQEFQRLYGRLAARRVQAAIDIRRAEGTSDV